MYLYVNIAHVRADVCGGIEDRIILSLLATERHMNKEIGYNYQISINNASDAKKIKLYYNELFIDNRTIDCQNEQKCITITEHLWDKGIYNLDLGAFGLNSEYQKEQNLKAYQYFRIKDSYFAACNYLKKMVAKYGMGWYAIASYHSQTEKFNYEYQKKLIYHYFNTSKDMSILR